MPKKAKYLNIEELKNIKDYISYEPNTGIFHWIKRKSNAVSKDTQCGSAHPKYKYIVIKFDNKNIRAHRLAWMFVYGSIAEGMEIDHINGIRTDNRIENLRAVTPRENSMNKVRHREGKLVGAIKLDIIKNKRRTPWSSHIKINGKLKNLGYFMTEIDAHNAYKKALAELNKWRDQ